MMAAGLLAKKAVEKGLRTPPWVKTSLAPGSRVVTDYYTRSGLLPYLDAVAISGGGVWVYDVHRELGAAADGCVEGDRRALGWWR